ncbi:TPA: carbohydrate-binding protein CenC [Listeria monocytogenes]|uniref:carbohydrate-binding protein CenC n=1 Tax=Listeria monocytogenes TaxID=1639 RepID=UPI001F59A6BE|nr:carbohydrate-binding protein CenC [Listeria monocytogenes]UNP22734.1 carbohydrate-binding protein CenC [Listeria monocytogenes]HAV0398611.1 carbohydrate-binding protein CenC [Listeria monocytogenes]HBZ6315373.1 carbohydrate-binding protein CenC [Listeria monocytogenes]HBZ6362801.1 carbohydrate-binding protein CenC [Listeria monocytogenes]HCJ2752058.1 carbohydrate-binding protein CenC [Listeria monocytogenes]
MTIRAAAEITLTDINDAIVAGEAPLNPTTDLLWMDSSASPNVLRRWDGEKWVSQTLNIKEADPETSQKIDEAITTANNALVESSTNHKPVFDKAQPSKPLKGDTWFKIDEITKTIIGVFSFNGESWEELPLDYNALRIGKLSAITAELGDVKSGSITGTEFIHNINYKDSDDNLYTGTVKMNDDGFNSTSYLPTGIGSAVLESIISTLGGYKVAQKLIDVAGESSLGNSILTSKSLQFNENGNIKLSIDADSFYKTSWKDLPLNAGYSTAEFNTPQYMILCIFGIRIVFFRGQVQKSTAWASANAFASVPLEIQTTRTAMAYAPTSKATGGRVHASSANAMSFMPADTSVTYFALNQLFYILD